MTDIFQASMHNVGDRWVRFDGLRWVFRCDHCAYWFAFTTRAQAETTRHIHTRTAHPDRLVAMHFHDSFSVENQPAEYRRLGWPSR